jgi:hypothetical protein
MDTSKFYIYRETANNKKWMTNTQLSAFYTIFSAIHSVSFPFSVQLRLERAVYLHESCQFSFVFTKFRVKQGRGSTYFAYIGFSIKKAKGKGSQIEWRLVS